MMSLVKMNWHLKVMIFLGRELGFPSVWAWSSHRLSALRSGFLRKSVCILAQTTILRHFTMQVFLNLDFMCSKNIAGGDCLISYHFLMRRPRSRLGTRSASGPTGSEKRAEIRTLISWCLAYFYCITDASFKF